MTVHIRQASLADYPALGFKLEPQPREAGGIPYADKHDRRGGKRVLLLKGFQGPWRRLS
ncbi:hypothetical protein [Gallaecimonas sp. GXIMD4217]|uniref:hypothetical protein n=1 Tax=Gallaecimonas sp. GXIMD4217 TaxID=3131927 RepID=UPI00311AF656